MAIRFTNQPKLMRHNHNVNPEHSGIPIKILFYFRCLKLDRKSGNRFDFIHKILLIVASYRNDGIPDFYLVADYLVNAGYINNI